MGTTDEIIDLRSDTVTRPGQRMRSAMASAEVGDDVYGEDPTVNRLESTVAEMLGHEAGLFCPTGSMANQVGIALLVQPGQELITDSLAHIVRAELAAGAALSGISTRTWESRDGIIDPDRVLAMVTPDAGPYMVSTAAVAVENTHNFAGGRVQPLAVLTELSQALRPGIKVHMDGARIWNAHAASGVPLVEYGRLFDTMSVCLSKGLGAPVGSVLVSSAEQIQRARVLRKRFGGGMRQVGVLAAAGLIALENIDRLAEDHRAARQLAEAIAAAAPAVVDPGIVDTNIVPLELAGTGWTGKEFAAAASRRGVAVSVLGPYRARVVTHLGVTGDEVARAGDVLAELLSTPGPSAR